LRRVHNSSQLIRILVACGEQMQNSSSTGSILQVSSPIGDSVVSSCPVVSDNGVLVLILVGIVGFFLGVVSTRFCCFSDRITSYCCRSLSGPRPSNPHASDVKYTPLRASVPDSVAIPLSALSVAGTPNLLTPAVRYPSSQSVAPSIYQPYRTNNNNSSFIPASKSSRGYL
jgi:hypothetical protein